MNKRLFKTVELNLKSCLSFYRVIYLIFMLLLLSLIFFVINTGHQSGDWEITQNTTVQDATVYVNGSINIRNPYTFTLINSIIYMNNTSFNGEFAILVENGATLNATDSQFLSNTNYRCNFTVVGGIYMDNCEVRGFLEIKLYSTSMGSINNTVIHETYMGIYLNADSHDFNFDNVTVYHAKHSGFFMINSYNNTFVDCNSSFNVLFGYQIFEISSNNTFIDCIAHNNSQHGFYVRGDNNTFNGCKAYYNAGDTRPFADAPPTADPWYYGFQVSGDYNVFDDIEVYEEFTGVQVTGDYNNFTNSNAHDMAAGYYGWWFQDQADHNRVENCVTYNVTKGMTLSNYTTVINHTAYNGLEGIAIGDYSNVLVENSTSYNMFSDGFVVAGTFGNEPRARYTNNILRNNTAFNCSGGPGFGFGMNSANVTVERCTSHNNFYGFGFYENASYITITDCSVYNNHYDFSFGYNSKALKNVTIVNTPTSGHLRFQHTLTHNVTLQVTSGILNCTTTDITIDSGGGSFCFTPSNDAEIQINYALLSVRVSGDQGNALRVITLGDTITVSEGDHVLILWGSSIN